MILLAVQQRLLVIAAGVPAAIARVAIAREIFVARAAALRLGTAFRATTIEGFPFLALAHESLGLVLAYCASVDIAAAA